MRSCCFVWPARAAAVPSNTRSPGLLAAPLGRLPAPAAARAASRSAAGSRCRARPPCRTGRMPAAAQPGRLGEVAASPRPAPGAPGAGSHLPASSLHSRRGRRARPPLPAVGGPRHPAARQVPRRDLARARARGSSARRRHRRCFQVCAHLPFQVLSSYFGPGGLSRWTDFHLWMQVLHNSAVVTA